MGLLVGLLVGKSYHTKQKDGYSLATNDPTIMIALSGEFLVSQPK